MYAFLLRQWQLGKVTKTQLEYAVTKGWITEEEMYKILNVPQTPQG